MNRRGMTFAEILIAIIFFMIGFGGLYFMFGTTNKQVMVTQYELIAYTLGRERLCWMDEADFNQVENTHDLLSQRIINEGYVYNTEDGKVKTYKYPDLYRKFALEAFVERPDSSDNFKRVDLTISYRVTPESETREVIMSKVVTSE